MEGKECGFVAVGSDQISPALSLKHLATQSSELIDRMNEVLACSSSLRKLRHGRTGVLSHATGQGRAGQLWGEGELLSGSFPFPSFSSNVCHVQTSVFLGQDKSFDSFVHFWMDGSALCLIIALNLNRALFRDVRLVGP